MTSARTRIALALCLGCACSAAALPAARTTTLPSSADVLAAGKRAFQYAHSNITTKGYECGWTRGTYMIGLWEYYKATNDSDALAYTQGWAENYEYELCGKKQDSRRQLQGPCEKDDLPCKDVHNANNQLCGATYVDMYMHGKDSPTHDKSHLDGTSKVLGAELADGADSDNFWSWVDAFFMAMNTWSRMGAATGDPKYHAKMWTNFKTSALLPADQKKTFNFWNASDGLFYRDDRFLGTQVYWGRGNGWAMGALVAAISHGDGSETARGMKDPNNGKYVEIFKAQAATLKKIADKKDGVWRSSLLDPVTYPTPEMTGSSSFVFGLAYGINAGILDPLEYLPVVEKAFGFMYGTALQPSGRYGFCQPVGGSPEHNINKDSTSDFCVGQFLLACSQVAKLSASL